MLQIVLPWSLVGVLAKRFHLSLDDFDKKWAGPHFGRFFNKPIWSHWFKTFFLWASDHLCTSSFSALHFFLILHFLSTAC
jgi:hypothetical protein